MEISITLNNTFNQTSILFQKIVKFSHRSDKGKVGKTSIENARYGPGKLYPITLNKFNS